VYINESLITPYVSPTATISRLIQIYQRRLPAKTGWLFLTTFSCVLVALVLCFVGAKNQRVAVCTCISESSSRTLEDNSTCKHMCEWECVNVDVHVCVCLAHLISLSTITDTTTTPTLRHAHTFPSAFKETFSLCAC
jgi:hypothetical protein